VGVAFRELYPTVILKCRQETEGGVSVGISSGVALHAAIEYAMGALLYRNG